MAKDKEKPLITAPMEKKVSRKGKKVWSKEQCKECALKSKCWSPKNMKNGELQKMCEE